MASFDRLVIGAGAFGLYVTRLRRRQGMNVAVIDLDDGPLFRASLINQARVHNGYHYPRSFHTAIHSSRYHERFARDFPSAINKDFDKLYAIASESTR